MTNPKEVALKLMGIREQCEFCKHWDMKIDPNYGWCDKDKGVRLCPGDYTTTDYLDKCDEFSPKTQRG